MCLSGQRLACRDCSKRLSEECETHTSIGKAVQNYMEDFALSVLNCAAEVHTPYQRCCIPVKSAPQVSSLISSKQQASDQHGDGQL